MYVNGVDSFGSLCFVVSIILDYLYFDNILV